MAGEWLQYTETGTFIAMLIGVIYNRAVNWRSYDTRTTENKNKIDDLDFRLQKLEPTADEIVELRSKHILAEQRLQKLEFVSEEVMKHHTNTDMHIVKGREDRNLVELKETITAGLSGLHERLGEIDKRYQQMHTIYGDHFGMIDRRIAAMSGKVNGE